MRQGVIKGLCLLMLVCSMAMSAQALAMVKTRVVFTINGRFHYRHFLLNKPLRYVIDLYNAKSILGHNRIRYVNTPIRNIRMGNNHRSTKRIVFDLRQTTHISSFVLKGKTAEQYRLVIDMSVAQHSPLKRHAEPLSYSKPIHLRASNIVPEAHVAHVDANVLQMQQNYQVASTPPRNIIVVIDPGHGGKDPGATGPGGTHEKNVVLAIAKDLQRYINGQPGFKAVLTRRADYFISLRGRLAIARRYKADMFIAIHADAYRNRSAEGVSVFALSQRGATSEAARWIAARENQSELMGGVELNDKSNILKSVLINLSQTATIRSSLTIGKDIISHVRGIARLHHPRVEQAAFVVLKSPDIPSLLVETGFLSNPYEEQRLRSGFYQNQIAIALERGIKQYFLSQPPRDTWLSYWRDHKRDGLSRYRVARGDTLTGIADRFRVTVAQIRSHNHLGSNDLTIGQQLLIPGK